MIHIHFSSCVQLNALEREVFYVALLPFEIIFSCSAASIFSKSWSAVAQIYDRP